MNDADVRADVAPPDSPWRASHRITIDDHGTLYVYWYVKSKPTCVDFRKVTHMSLVNLMHSKGPPMPIGARELLYTQGTNYALVRQSRLAFTIEALD